MRSVVRNPQQRSEVLSFTDESAEAGREGALARAAAEWQKPDQKQACLPRSLRRGLCAGRLPDAVSTGRILTQIPVSVGRQGCVLTW